MYDLGCGNGGYLKIMYKNGFTKLTGIEGNIPKYKEYHDIIEQDLTKPFELANSGNCIFFRSCRTYSNAI